MAADTKDRIVTAAVELFNAASVGAVTTNHIAAHLSISPGNLYYHFANKEEIVRAAFERMNAEADALWDASASSASTSKFDPLLLQRIVVGNLQLYARYIFFARELAALLRADKVLRDRYAEISAQRMDQLVAALEPLADRGILVGVGDEDDLRSLAESAWMIGLFCVPYAETLDAAPAGATRTAKGRAARTRAALVASFAIGPAAASHANAGLVGRVGRRLSG